MGIVLIILCVLVVVALIIVTAMRPVQSSVSTFELKRRAEEGGREAKDRLHREALLVDVASFLQIVRALLLVVSVALLVATFGWLFGIIIAVVVALEYGAIAKLSAVQHQSQKFYETKEPYLLQLVARFPGFFRFVRHDVLENTDRFQRLDSRQELQHIIAESGDVLNRDEKNLIVSSLSFPDEVVKSIMTPKSMIDTVKSSEFLGPLVLSELHDLGHSRLPVIKEDIDHIVGILHTNDLLSLDVRKSVTAEKAMEAKVYYIHEDESLQHALAAFLKVHHHLFIVVNEYRETVGLLTLEDVIEKLIGRKIYDEDDNHSDLRTMALRNIHGNNEPDGHTDV